MTGHPPVPAVALTDARRLFGTKVAVDGVSFDVEAGEVFGLLGHNGAGKTTLIRMINGLLPADAGEVRTLGLDPVRDGDRVRSRVGVLTEYPALDDFLTPLENLRVYGAVYGVDPADVEDRAHALVDRLGLSEHAAMPARSLSAGLKQRVALARSLIHQPDLLLLDEPTSNLDPIAARGVRELVLELSREHGRTVVLSTHNLLEAQDLCDRVAIILEGRLVAVGSLRELGRDLDRGQVHFTVEPGQASRAMKVLEEVGATDVAPLARDGRLTARLPHVSIPDAVAAMVQSDLRVGEVAAQVPTLEDVYLSLHGSSVGDARIAAGPP